MQLREFRADALNCDPFEIVTTNKYLLLLHDFERNFELGQPPQMQKWAQARPTTRILNHLPGCVTYVVSRYILYSSFRLHQVPRQLISKLLSNNCIQFPVK